ncbi:hypothetical protein K0M31_013088 [Melipona bicolor]|uniref:Uncharacterized protein n=1 Tax=Melipona bicolor TaxID=60889 RepID=A0AA40FJF7_9HYME|nr:hypothetical protein K0M31_013088 [Melipona bicolor]
MPVQEFLAGIILYTFPKRVDLLKPLSTAAGFQSNFTSKSRAIANVSLMRCQPQRDGRSQPAKFTGGILLHPGRRASRLTSDRKSGLAPDQNSPNATEWSQWESNGTIARIMR